MATCAEGSKVSAKKSLPWFRGLSEAKSDPSKHLDSNDKCIIIRDGYPKSRHHYLVLPRRNIPNLTSLTTKDVPLLENMLEFSKLYLNKVHGVNYGGINFRCGYHAVPSMKELHMHVISQDFDSICLKNKKHWNSFTTDFFLDATKVISIINDRGCLEINREYYEGLLKGPLVCHVCGKEQVNLPTLKRHFKSHNN